MLFFIIAAAGVALDQWTKYLILTHLALGQKIPCGVFDIAHVQNRGAAFGMLQNAGYLFVIIAVVVLASLFAGMSRIREAGRLVEVSLALIAGGTVGNLIDRLRFGYVVDFIDFRWWPVFNVADSCICIGVGLLVWKIFRQSHAEGSQTALAGHLPEGHAEPNNTPLPPL